MNRRVHNLVVLATLPARSILASATVVSAAYVRERGGGLPQIPLQRHTYAGSQSPNRRIKTAVNVRPLSAGVFTAAVVVAVMVGAVSSQPIAQAQEIKPQTAVYGEIKGEKLALDVYEP